jgi:hypothetical protein
MTKWWLGAAVLAGVARQTQASCLSAKTRIWFLDSSDWIFWFRNSESRGVSGGQ